MKKRVSSKSQAKKSESEYFDDCFLCREMEKAEKEGKVLTVSETTKLFKKANEQN